MEGEVLRKKKSEGERRWEVGESEEEGRWVSGETTPTGSRRIPFATVGGCPYI